MPSILTSAYLGPEHPNMSQPALTSSDDVKGPSESSASPLHVLVTGYGVCNHSQSLLRPTLTTRVAALLDL